MGEREGHARHREEQPCHGTAERAEQGEDDRQRVAAPLEGQQGGQPERHAERERQPAGEEQGGGGHAEPDRAPARPVRSEVAARQRLEEGGRGQRGERQGQRRAEQPRDRRRDDAVGGRVMAAVPLAVPDREALLAEQVGPEGVRREVHGARLPDQVDDREHQRHEERGEPPPVDAAPPPLRRSGTRPARKAAGAGRDLAGLATRRRRDCGERGPEHGGRRLAEGTSQE